jgi:hypothetical protein
MTAQEAETEFLSIAGCLRDHADAESDPNPDNLRKVARWAADEIEKLVAILDTEVVAMAG